jgi:hypothetical protein
MEEETLAKEELEDFEAITNSSSSEMVNWQSVALHVYISLPTHRADALRWTNIITSLGSCCVSRLEGRFRLFREEK